MQILRWKTLQHFGYAIAGVITGAKDYRQILRQYDEKSG